MLTQLERRGIHCSACTGMEMSPIQLSEATCSRHQCWNLKAVHNKKGDHLKKANWTPIQWHSLGEFTSAWGQLSALQFQEPFNQEPDYLEVNQNHGCWLILSISKYDIEKQNVTSSGKPNALGLAGWDLRICIVTSTQVMPILLVHGPHFTDQGSR